MPLEDADIGRNLLVAIVGRVGAKSQITDDLDHTALLDAGLLHPICDVLVCGAVVERSDVLISMLRVDHKAEYAVVPILSSLVLRVIDQAALHDDRCVHCHSSFLPFGLKYSKRLTTHGTKSSSRSRTKKKTEADGNRVTIHDSA